ncbi:hypothetical protein [Bifidobacterium animalis]|uniref:hypothetical protein n=1 Tax=Bifidobacterium animalis TaxID=28025 RepID=UPI001BCE041A|nr:hypothetical protein [Bifidobacterium animalis]
MAMKNYKRHGVHKVAYLIDGEEVPEGIWKRRYVAAIEAELEAAHEKLAKIYEIL